MDTSHEEDWDPRSEAVQRDQRAAYDEMRERCPVAYSRHLGWSVFRHGDVLRVLNDPATFSSVVSAHPAVPNGMDPPQHTAYRRVIDPYFEPQRMHAFEPACREIAARLERPLVGRGPVDFVGEFGDRFAVEVQCTFLGWPAAMQESMRLWTQKNYASRLAEDRAAMAQVAREFEQHVLGMLRARRESADPAADDVTTRLMRERVGERTLNDDEIVSILRNWTVGEISTISAAVGIVAWHVCAQAELQQRLRAEPSLLPDAIEEILRIHGPLVSNRRVTSRPVEIAGRQISAGERISVNWIAANRDGRVFEGPDTFRTDRDPAANLLYGAGIHVCPGAPLARMELRVVMEELLALTRAIEPVAARPPVPATSPGSGFSTLFLRLE